MIAAEPVSPQRLYLRSRETLLVGGKASITGHLSIYGEAIFRRKCCPGLGYMVAKEALTSHAKLCADSHIPHVCEVTLYTVHVRVPAENGICSNRIRPSLQQTLHGASCQVHVD